MIDFDWIVKLSCEGSIKQITETLKNNMVFAANLQPASILDIQGEFGWLE